MPTYEVTDPESGRRVRLTGDSPPTAVELDELFKSLPEQKQATQPMQQGAASNGVPRETRPMSQMVAEKIKPQATNGQQLPKGSLMNYVNEPVFSILSNLGGKAVAGYAGMFGAATEGSDRGKQNVQGIQQKVAQETVPTTQRGQKGLEVVSDLVDYGIDLTRYPLSGVAGLVELLAGQGPEQAEETIKQFQEKGFKAAGDRIMEETDNAVLATMTEMLPEITGTMYLKGLKQRGLNRDIGPRLDAGDQATELARYRRDLFSGDVVPDKLMGPLKRAKFDEGALQVFKTASDSDKQKLLKMVERKKRSMEDARWGLDNRASDVAGESLLERVKYVRQVNQQAAQKLDDVAKNLQGQTVQFDAPVSRFIDDLRDLGVEFDAAMNPVYGPRSAFYDLQGPQQAINRIVNRLKAGEPGQMPDAYDLHLVKKYIDETVTYGKQAEGLAGKAESVIKRLRHNIDEALDSQFDDYNAVNTTYADTVTAIDALQDVAGKKMDLLGPNADKAVGTLLRRLMSNAQSRINLMDAIEMMDTTAKRYGANFGDDIGTQVLFANELDKAFGVSAETSLAGEVAKAGAQTARETAGGGTDVGRAMQIAQGVKDAALKPNQDKAFRLLEELLTRQ